MASCPLRNVVRVRPKSIGGEITSSKANGVVVLGQAMKGSMSACKPVSRRSREQCKHEQSARDTAANYITEQVDLASL